MPIFRVYFFCPFCFAPLVSFYWVYLCLNEECASNPDQERVHLESASQTSLRSLNTIKALVCVPPSSTCLLNLQTTGVMACVKLIPAFSLYFSHFPLLCLSTYFVWWTEDLYDGNRIFSLGLCVQKCAWAECIVCVYTYIYYTCIYVWMSACLYVHMYCMYISVYVVYILSLWKPHASICSVSMRWEPVSETDRLMFKHVQPVHVITLYCRCSSCSNFFLTSLIRWDTYFLSYKHLPFHMNQEMAWITYII